MIGRQKDARWDRTEVGTAINARLDGRCYSGSRKRGWILRPTGARRDANVLQMRSIDYAVSGSKDDDRAEVEYEGDMVRLKAERQLGRLPALRRGCKGCTHGRVQVSSRRSSKRLKYLCEMTAG